MAAAPFPAPSPESGGTYPLPGTLIDNKYEVEGVLGSGGMGVVVAARHIGLQQRFAIKFLTKNLDDPQTVARFEREARAAVELKSEHVVRVTDVGALPSGAPYMVMELLDGHDLGSLVEKRGPLRITEAVGYMLQACEAVAEAHSRGIIHRDLKPGNLFLTERPDGTAQIKVVDFGVSKLERGTPEGTDFQLTGPASLLGSPYYMSPEQVRCSRDVDTRTDIWSMGVTLYELLTGKRAFTGDNLPALSAKIVTEAVVPASSLRPEIPPGLDAIIRRCLSRDREQRFPSVAELASALSSFAGSDARIAGRRAIRISRQSSPENGTGSGRNKASPPARLPSPSPPAAKHSLDFLDTKGGDTLPAAREFDTRSGIHSGPANWGVSQRRSIAVLVVAAVLLFAVGLSVRAFTTRADAPAFPPAASAPTLALDATATPKTPSTDAVESTAALSAQPVPSASTAYQSPSGSSSRRAIGEVSDPRATVDSPDGAPGDHSPSSVDTTPLPPADGQKEGRVGPLVGRK